jgi:hypothetical protein
MAKDIIFKNLPQQKVKIGFTVPVGKQRNFSKDEINLDEWRIVGLSEKLLKGDIYDNGKVYTTTVGEGNFPATGFLYYRKKQFKNYDLLVAGTLLQEGDEFFNSWSGKWLKLGNNYHRPADSIWFYRRPIVKS